MKDELYFGKDEGEWKYYWNDCNKSIKSLLDEDLCISYQNTIQSETVSDQEFIKQVTENG